MKRIALIAKFFGKPNDYLRFWFFSASKNPTIDFLFLTDVPSSYVEYSEHKNIHFVSIDAQEFAQRALSACPGVDKIETKDFGYHCNQFRPLFGVMFADLLKDYDYWGYVDTDVVFGDIRAFFPDELLSKYDKFLERGHFTLYRNDPEVNDRYLLSTKHCRIDYKKICRTSLNYGFDEMHGINRVYEAEGFPYYANFGILLDLAIFRDELTPHQEANSFYGHPIYLDYESPKLFCVDAESGRRQEMLYAHFQKRKMIVPEFLESDHYRIVPNEALPAEQYDEAQAITRANIRTPAIRVALRTVKAKIKSIPRYVGLILLFAKRS